MDSSFKNVNAERKKFCKIIELREKANFDYGSSDKSFLSHPQELCADNTEAEGKMKLNKNIIMRIFPNGLWNRFKTKREKKRCYPVECLICGKIDENGHIRQHLKTHKIECKCVKRAKYCSCKLEEQYLKNKMNAVDTDILISQNNFISSTRISSKNVGNIQDNKFSNLNNYSSEEKNSESIIISGQSQTDPLKRNNNIGLWYRLKIKRNDKKCYPVECLICGKIDETGRIREHLKTHKIECKCVKRAKYCTCENKNSLPKVDQNLIFESKLSKIQGNFLLLIFLFLSIQILIVFLHFQIK